jgi:beta-lactamase class A
MPRNRRGPRLPAVILAGALLAVGTGAALAESAAVSLTVIPSAVGLPYASPLAVTGALADGGLPESGVEVKLQSEPYPYRRYVTVANTTTDATGFYTFASLVADRDMRVRVLAAASTPSKPITITVDPRVSLFSRSLGPGRVRLRVGLAHTTHFHGSPAVSVWWYAAPTSSRAFHLVAVSPAREASPGVTSASATVDPPSALFTYRACLNAPWEKAMGAQDTHGPCPHHDFVLGTHPVGYGGGAHGRPRAGYPSPAALASAERFLDERAGHTALAVVNSAGHLAGVRMQDRFETASVIKVMFLTAYLQMRAAQHRGLSEEDRSLLYPMIHISDNDAASAVLDRVGEGAVERVAREAGMSAYEPGVEWWAYSQTDAADQARFFTELEAMIPHQFYGYARELMSTIEPEQSWGFPPVARPAWQVYFKTGALPSRGLFGETALLERDGVSFTVSVLTDGDPSMAYGEQTIEGVAERLLAATP